MITALLQLLASLFVTAVHVEEILARAIEMTNIYASQFVTPRGAA